MLCRGRVSAGTLWPTAPFVRMEDSPSPVYGAALLMRLGVTTLRGSNPRSSAVLTWESARCARAPIVVLTVIDPPVRHTSGTAGNVGGDRDLPGPHPPGIGPHAAHVPSLGLRSVQVAQGIDVRFGALVPDPVVASPLRTRIVFSIPAWMVSALVLRVVRDV